MNIKCVQFTLAGAIMALAIWEYSIVDAIIGGAFWIGACITLNKDA